MSWFDKYRTNPQPSAATREARRLQLEEERLLRKQKREQYQQQLNAAAKAQEEANQALEDLLNIAPDLFEGDEIDKEVSLDILDESDSMTDFDTENGVDGDKAMEKLGAVKCEFDKSDIENWFSELEGQLEVIEVKAQWTKRTALQRFLRGNTSAGRNFWPGQNFCLQAEISSKAGSPEPENFILTCPSLYVSI